MDYYTINRYNRFDHVDQCNNTQGPLQEQIKDHLRTTNNLFYKNPRRMRYYAQAVSAGGGSIGTIMYTVFSSVKKVPMSFYNFLFSPSSEKINTVLLLTFY